MTRHNGSFRWWSHDISHVIGELGGDLEQSCLARGAVIVNRRLDYRDGIIDIVLLDVVATIKTPPVSGRLQLGPRVQVAVRVPGCRGGNALDIAIDAGFQRGVAFRGQEIGATADHLVDQTVIPRRAGMVAPGALSNSVEVGE